MARGESARQNCPSAILTTLLEKESGFESIVVSVNFSRGTVDKYLTELFQDSLVTRRGRRGAYYLTPKGCKKASMERLKGDIYNLVDSFGTKWLQILSSLVNNMRNEGTDPEVFFRSNCLAFLGGIPYTFEKSIEGMKYVQSFEKDIEVRGAKEGLTKEECFKKLLTKISKQPKGFPRLLTYMSFFLTKEGIEELRKQQGGTFTVTRRRPKRFPAALNDIWIEEGII